MLKNSGGYYTKYFNIGENPILAFTMNREDGDNNYITEKLLNKTAFQTCNDEELKNPKIQDILYTMYSYSGKQLYNILLHFDFNNNSVTIGNKTYKIESCYDYTYKIMKTKIKASNGIEGFYKFVTDSMNINESPFNSLFYNVLEKASKEAITL